VQTTTYNRYNTEWCSLFTRILGAMFVLLWSNMVDGFLLAEGRSSRWRDVISGPLSREWTCSCTRTCSGSRIYRIHIVSPRAVSEAHLGIRHTVITPPGTPLTPESKYTTQIPKARELQNETSGMSSYIDNPRDNIDRSKCIVFVCVPKTWIVKYRLCLLQQHLRKYT
jgi:hypothetical protein